jgi:hypothetical protein
MRDELRQSSRVLERDRRCSVGQEKHCWTAKSSTASLKKQTLLTTGEEVLRVLVPTGSAEAADYLKILITEFYRQMVNS